jgi:glycosyltransferase involved in cell wall biosynthesis
MLKIMGETGFVYARKVADWDRVIDRYIDTFKRIIADYNHRDPSDKKQSIHQLLPNLAYGDAISSQALMIRELLLSEGYDSHIYAQNIDPRVKAFCKPLKDIELNPSDALIYHHSIGFDRVDLITGHPGKKALIYHNITPKDFFEDYNTQVAAMLTDGRKHLKDLAAVFDYNYGVSDFNCDELRLKGFKDPRVLPLLVSSEKWNFLPDAHTIKLFSDHKKNILFTGRISPNKKQTDLVKMMYHLKKIDPDTRLILVGGGKDERDPYYMELKSLIHDAHLEHDIIITNQISEAELKAFFMVSDLFVSMSEHEGFGVPLVEAMWFDIPVLAYKSTAVPETLGEAGIMFVHKKEMGRVAGVAKLIMSDKETGDAIIGAQRVVRENYSHSTVRDDYLQMIKDLADA